MEKINLLCDGIPNCDYNGNVIYSSDIADENYFYLEYLTKDSSLINRVNLNYFDSNANQNYVFLLPIHLIHYYELGNIIKQNSEFSEILINLFNSKNVKVVFYDFHEIGNPDDINLFVKSIENELDISRFIFINNDSKIKEYKQKYNWNFNVQKTHHLIYHMSGRLMDYDITLKLENKEKLFLCKNKVGKPHRVSISAFLENFVNDDSNYSLMHPHSYPDIELYRDSLFNEPEYSWFFPYVEKMLKSKPKNTLWEQHRKDFFDDSGDVFIDFAGDLNIKDYEESYINITTESVFFEDNIHISEKSLKPFAFYQLPLIMASKGHLNVLENTYGFDMFRDLIDHGYDHEVDPIKRLFMIFDEVKRLQNKKLEVIDFYKSNKNRLIKNREIVKNIFEKNIDLEIYNLLKSDI